MLHVVFVAPFFGDNMRHCLACFADLPGVTLSVVTQEPAERVPPQLRGRLHHWRIDNVEDARQIVAGARGIERHHGRLDRIESYLEMLQVPVAEARDELQLPGIRADVARNFRDKNRMKDVLRQAGVPVARQALVRDAEDARRFAAEVGFPIVLKPLAGFGARNTQRATDDASLAAALEALLPSADKPVQAEEFVRGEEHTFETVMVDGRPVWWSSVQYLPSPLQVLENAWMQYCLLLPREQHPPHVQSFQPVNAAALRALGLVDGISHMEWFLRADGTPVVSEVGARPPGANIMPLLAAAHACDPWALWAQLVVQKRWQIPARRFAAGCVFVRAMGGGPVIRSVQGLDEVRRQLGDRITAAKLPQVGQPRSSHYEGDGFFVVRDPETQGVVAAMKAILETVRIV
ncbi:MAG: ATP-grasp domain-containing protein [Planctomycetes bacterium]|nr:ATP-grasp domain-containing protein [Planctomycetota bacterium]